MTYEYLNNTSNSRKVIDYLAGMTDDYFIDLCEYLLPDAPKVKYTGYFDRLERNK